MPPSEHSGIAVGHLALTTIRLPDRSPLVQGAYGRAEAKGVEYGYGGVAFGLAGRTGLFIGVQGRPSARCATWPDRVPRWLRPVASFLCRTKSVRQASRIVERQRREFGS